MINYSIYPPDYVFENWDNYQPEYQEVSTGKNTSIIVEEIDNHELQLVQIISSDPQDYLKKEIAPGKILKKTYYLK